LLRGKVQPSSVNLCKMDIRPSKMHVTEIFQQTAYLLFACTTEYSRLQVPNHVSAN
jgi:hypothetical protein